MESAPPSSPLEERMPCSAEEAQVDDEETEEDEDFLKTTNDDSSSDESCQRDLQDTRPANAPLPLAIPSTSNYRYCSILLGNAHLGAPITADTFMPGMRVLGVHETGLLESARVEEIMVATNELLLTWLSGSDVEEQLVLPMSRIRYYAGHFVGTEDKTEFDFACDEAIRRQNHLRNRDAASMRVPDADTKRRLVPLMMQMLDAFPLADEDFNLLPERAVACTPAELRPYSRKKVRGSRERKKKKRKKKMVNSQLATRADGETGGDSSHMERVASDDDTNSSSSSGMFFGIHPDEARASDAQMTVDQPVVKAALVRVFKSLVSKEERWLTR